MEHHSAQEILKRNNIAYVATKKKTYTTDCPHCNGGYLNVKIDRDGVAWYCHHCLEGGGEKFEQRDQTSSSSLGPIKATYNYVDEDGALLFQALRYDPVGKAKEFRQRKGPDQEKWSIKGVRLVPFMLPELLEDIASERTIFIVEGEKDVLTLRQHNVPATTNPMGAGKWKPEFNSLFRDANVVVITDNDQPGRDHARMVAQNLQGVSARLRLLDLKEFWPQIEQSDDISDWFEAGYSVHELLEIVDSLPDWTPPSGNGHTDWPEWPDAPTSPTTPTIPIINPLPAVLSEMPCRPWLVPGLLLRRQVTLLVAPPGSGKSLLTLQLALMACAQMPEWGGWRPRSKYRTLIINVEEDQDEMTRRLGAAAKVMQIEQDELGGLYLAKADTIVIARADSRTKTVIATPTLGEIERVITENQIDIVVVDPFAETFEGDENSNSELKWAAVLWRTVARKTNCSVMLIHHAKKYSSGMAGDPDAGRGAGALTGVARIVATLFGMTEKEADGFADQQCVDGTIFDPEQRNRYIRFDDAKANQSLVSIKAKWFYKTSVSLDNARDGVPADEVGVLVPWKPPTIWSRMDIQQANLILDMIARGFINDDGSSSGDPFTMGRKSGKSWAGIPIVSILQCDDKDAAAVLKKWVSEGLIDVRKTITGRSKGKERECAFVNNSKRPGVVTEETML